MVFKKSLISEDKIRLKILDLLSRREHSFEEILLKLKDRVDSKDKLNEELIKIRDENLQSDKTGNKKTEKIIISLKTI